ncbi:putative nucleic acid-binding protein [Arabidopsis thaliana]
MTFVTGTQVIRCDSVSDSSYLSLATFANIQAGDSNPAILVGVRSFSNSFYASQVHINPDFPEVQAFVSRMMTVSNMRGSQSVIFFILWRVVCTIYALDTDWSWYYFSCRNCNKKGTHIHAGVNTTSLKSSKPRFWCDVCKNGVTNVQAK